MSVTGGCRGGWCRAVRHADPATVKGLLVRDGAGGDVPLGCSGAASSKELLTPAQEARSAVNSAILSIDLLGDGSSTTALISSPASPEAGMILSDLLGRPVVAHELLGYVTDVRFHLHDDGPDGRPGEAELYGIIVSPKARFSALGFERTGVRSPWPVAAFERWWHRKSILIRWSDIASIDEDGIQLRAGYSRYSAQLGPVEG